MKIQSIEIENFQSHKHTEIDLHPGVNVIVGPSDVGKSSILRAINWILTNRPSGNTFESNWENDGTSVYLEFGDGSIERVRDKQFNGYILNRQQEFKGFGLAIPKEIQDFLNINEINVQSQFDSPFMLSWTPGERGAFLNKIVDLEITDRTIGNIKSNILSERRYITGLEEDIKELEEELEEYEYLDQYESDLVKIEKAQEEYDGVSKRTIRLTRSLCEAKILRDEIEALSHIPKLFRMVSETEIDLDNLKYSQDRNKKLKRIIDSAKDYKETCESLKDVANFKRSIDKIDVDIDEYKSIKKQALSLMNTLHKIAISRKRISEKEKDLRKGKEQFDRLMPERCPLCGK